MPSIIDPIKQTGDCYISIYGDTLKISPSLKPKPSAGIHVWFTFEVCDTGGKHLEGNASLWPRPDVEPRPADADNFRDLEGLDGLDDVNPEMEMVTIEDFRRLKGSPMAKITLLDLAEIQLGDQTHLRLEEAFIEGTLRSFLDTYDVTAEIDCLADDVVQTKILFADGAGPAYTFIFEVDRETAEQLFTFEKTSPP